MDSKPGSQHSYGVFKVNTELLGPGPTHPVPSSASCCGHPQRLHDAYATFFLFVERQQKSYQKLRIRRRCTSRFPPLCLVISYQSTPNMAQYDLSRRLIPNLDRHLVRPILEFLESECSLYPAEDLMKARYELLKGSNMINYLGPLVQSIKGGPEDVMPQGESTTLLELSGWEGRI